MGVETEMNKTSSLSLRTHYSVESQIHKQKKILYNVINANIEIYAKCFSRIGKKGLTLEVWSRVRECFTEFVTLDI